MQKTLEGLRILDLSRVLAGPYCTQMLGDLGAEVIKIEKPFEGDDTRAWGPPYLQDADGADTTESAYYLSCNRGKKSVAVDLKHAEGQRLIHDLLAHCDVLIENFKVGGLKKYGLDFETVHARHPHIVYASITGFGQTGPLSSEPGYDFVAQAMSGFMASTGAPGGEPMKAGVAISDIITGLNAASGILAALYARKHSGLGQHIDVGLVDCTLAAMTNIAQYYLTSGRTAPRVGNAHSTIVPYQAFETKDGHIIVAVGNNGQFRQFCTHIGKPEWADDDRFATNSARVANRETLVPMIREIMAARTTAEWIKGLQDVDVPCGPVHSMDKVFKDPQVLARGMKIEMPHPFSEVPVPLVGSPLKLSGTPVDYTLPPPVRGQHTREVLQKLLDLSAADLEKLERDKVIETGTL